MSYQDLLAESRRLYKLIDDLRTTIDKLEENPPLQPLKERRDFYIEYSLLSIYERHFYALEEVIRKHEWLNNEKRSYAHKSKLDKEGHSCSTKI